MMQPSIQASRLTLRRFDAGDVDDLLRLTSEPSVAKAAPEIGTRPELVWSYISAQRALAPFAQDRLFDLAVSLRPSGTVVGLVTLIRREHGAADIGWAIREDHRNQGLATEAASALVDHAFTTLGLDLARAETDAENVASLRVIEKLHMRPEDPAIAMPPDPAKGALRFTVDQQTWRRGGPRRDGAGGTT